LPSATTTAIDDCSVLSQIGHGLLRIGVLHMAKSRKARKCFQNGQVQNTKKAWSKLFESQRYAFVWEISRWKHC